MAYVVVPSDVTVMENKYRVGRKALGWFERIGVYTMAPVYHNNYTKMSGDDMRAVLQRKFDKTSNTPEVELCIARQQAVSRQARSHVGFWAGAGAFGGLSFWSLRKYDWKTRLSFVPLMAYVGCCVGRVFGDIVTGRTGETYRDRQLAELPAKVYLNTQQPAQE